MKYEIHVTSSQKLIESFHAKTGYKILHLEYITPNSNIVQTDWMTAVRSKDLGSLGEALDFLAQIEYQVSPTPSGIIRAKLEVPYSKDLELDPLYLETHYEVDSVDEGFIGLPISMNLATGELIATARCYNPGLFGKFIQTHRGGGRKIEAVLIDSNPAHDNTWFQEWT